MLPRVRLLLSASALLRPAPASAALSQNLVPGTHCMDGTTAGYYYRAPPKASALWVINLAGGGGCATEAKCAKRAKTDHGSSKGWNATVAPSSSSSVLISDDPAVNPDFAAAHHVHVMYCTSDTHRGTRNATGKETWGFYFSGHRNLAAFVDDLLATKGLGSATQVLLAGGSAGGVGTFYNLDWLADKLGSGVTVKGAPNAGWFFPGALPADLPHKPYLPPPPYACFAAGRPSPAGLCTSDEPSKAADELWQSYKPPACAAGQASGDAWRCDTVHVLYPFVRQPVYVIENQYDTNQLYNQAGVPRGSPPNATTVAYITMYGEAMRNSTAQVRGNTAKRDGLFLPSCLQHGVGNAKEKIDSRQWLPILGDWFFARGELSKYHQLVDDCTMAGGLPCNAAANCQLSGGPAINPTTN